MTKDCYATCPKCKHMGWCHYKGKAHIFKSGPGSETYKVSIFKCGNCGKKFGFELEDGVMEPKDELDTMLEDLANDYEIEEATSYKEIKIFANILYDHIYDDPCNINNIKFVRDTIKRIINIADKCCDEEEEDNDWEEITEILAEAYKDLNLSFHPNDFYVVTAMHGVECALRITKKHCGRDS